MGCDSPGTISFGPRRVPGVRANALDYMGGASERTGLLLQNEVFSNGSETPAGPTVAPGGA